MFKISCPKMSKGNGSEITWIYNYIMKEIIATDVERNIPEIGIARNDG